MGGWWWWGPGVCTARPPVRLARSHPRRVPEVMVQLMAVDRITGFSDAVFAIAATIKVSHEYHGSPGPT